MFKKKTTLANGKDTTTAAAASGAAMGEKAQEAATGEKAQEAAMGASAKTGEAGAQSASETPLLQVKGLKAGYDGKEIVHGVDFEVSAGEFVCVIGANGCGKSTLLKNMLGLSKPFEGAVVIDGCAVAEQDERWRAQRFAYIPQSHTPPFPFKVADVVILGRTPYRTGISSATTKRDRLIAYRALRQLSIEHLADATYTELSGGQQQLVLIARALVQQPKLLVMDEPTAALDFGNQHLVLSRMHELSRLGMAVIMVTHDPDHALYCADRVLVMEEGRIINDGTPEETITTETLQRIYSSDVCVADVTAPDGRTMRVCVPLMKEEESHE